MLSKIIGIVQQFQVIENFIKSLKEKACVFYVIPDLQITGALDDECSVDVPTSSARLPDVGKLMTVTVRRAACVDELMGGQYD